MRMSDIAYMAISNLWQRKLRSFLTILGVIIGTVSIVIMLALGEGDKQMFIENVSQGANLTQITVMDSGGYSMDGSSQQSKVILNDKAIDAFKKIDGVIAATPWTYLSAYIETGKYTNEYLSLVAVDPGSLEDLDYKLEDGRFLNPNTNKFEIVMGSNVKGTFFNPSKPPKDSEMEEYFENGPPLNWLSIKYKMLLGGTYMYEGFDEDQGAVDAGGEEEEKLLPANYITPKVVGVLEKSGTQESYYAFMSLDVLKKYLKANKKVADAMKESMGVDPTKYQQAIVRVKDMDTVDPVMKAIKDAGFQCYSDTEYIKENQKEQQRKQTQWAIVGLIAYFIAAIGIANTMFTSIIERTKDIGVMKVLGCKHSNLGNVFLFEAGLIGLIGGIIGLIIGIVLSYLITDVPWLSELLAGSEGGMARAVVEPLTGIGVLVFSVVIGMVSGIFPSLRAMKLSPLAAIRNE